MPPSRKRAYDITSRRRVQARGNVANVRMLPIPMLPVSNWELVLGFGNILTLATFISFLSLFRAELEDMGNTADMGAEWRNAVSSRGGIFEPHDWEL